MSKDFRFFIDSSALSRGPLTVRVFCAVEAGELHLALADGTPVLFCDLAEREQAEILELMCLPLEDLAWQRHKIIAREYSEWRKSVGA
jgi:hypothetical protein